MNLTYVKFFIIGTICLMIEITTSMPLDVTVNTPNTRLKRSPANNFSLFGIKTPFSVPNPLTKVKETFNSFGGIFAPATGNTDKDFKPKEPQSVINNNETINTVSPIEDSNQSGIQSSKVELTSLKKVDKKPVQQEDKNKENIKQASEKQQLFNDKSRTKTKPAVSQRNNYDSENKKVDDKFIEDNIFNGAKNESIKEKLPSENLEKEIDKKLLDYIFHITPDSNVSTTAESDTDYTTETGDYESTTTDELLRIPSNVVASLLG